MSKPSEQVSLGSESYMNTTQATHKNNIITTIPIMYGKQRTPNLEMAIFRTPGPENNRCF